MAFGDAEHGHWRLAQVARAVGARYHHCRAAIALQTAVEQAKRVGNHARCLMVFDGHGLGHHRPPVQDCMAPSIDRHFGEMQ